MRYYETGYEKTKYETKIKSKFNEVKFIKGQLCRFSALSLSIQIRDII